VALSHVSPLSLVPPCFLNLMQSSLHLDTTNSGYNCMNGYISTKRSRSKWGHNWNLVPPQLWHYTIIKPFIKNESFFSMDLNTCVVASLSRIINLESLKMYFMYNKVTMDRSFLSTCKFQMYFFVWNFIYLFSQKDRVCILYQWRAFWYTFWKNKKIKLYT
jgi:hypothetical protein